jgi:hypothetical protein
MYTAIDCVVNEIYMKDLDSFYNNINIPIYNMDLKLIYGNIMFLELRIVEILNNINENKVIFKFINMKKFSRRVYTNYCDLHTEFILDIKTNILVINYYTYCLTGEKYSKNIISTVLINIEKCRKLQHFLFYIYNQHKNINKIPKSRY